ncbi:MAG: nitroreductase family protein [Candidatus Melainabacteria bacterium]|nr:nitroreductase family protein [Candidatus Melainabacteria bacterium]
MLKPAETSYDVHPLIQQRWSPRALADTPIEPWKLCALLEAARWSPSSYNEQPWRFVVGTQPGADASLNTLRTLLLPGNDWAQRAPMLVLALAKRTFTQTGEVNRHAWHDVGIAMAAMAFQAQALGLFTHMMAGFEAKRAVVELALPPEYEPVSMMAVGYYGDPGQLSQVWQQEAEHAPRVRKPLQELVFSGYWGQAYSPCHS